MVDLQEWGAEGYHLWMVNNKPATASTPEENTTLHKTELLQMHFVKSALATNPCTVSLLSHSFCLFLFWEKCSKESGNIYLRPCLNETCIERSVIFTARVAKRAKVMFSQVKDHNTPPPPGQGQRSKHPPPRHYAQAGGTHPTGMHSCLRE